jgi:hypothetical protein
LCRGAALPDASAASGSSGGQAGADSGASCRVAYQTYPSGSVNVPPPKGCGSCRCADGQLVCTEASCALGTPVIAYRDTIPEGDPIDVTSSSISGDTLTLTVGHGGGCERHDYALGFNGYVTTAPAHTELVLVHDAHGDTCEAYVTETLTFDLTPLAQDYRTYVSATDGLVDTNYGLYVFPDLACDERTRATQVLVSRADADADRSCISVADCVFASIDTPCTATCGSTIVSAAGQTDLQTQIADIATTCGDFEADGCGPVIPPSCPPAGAVGCVGGACVLGG